MGDLSCSHHLKRRADRLLELQPSLTTRLEPPPITPAAAHRPPRPLSRWGQNKKTAHVPHNPGAHHSPRPPRTSTRAPSWARAWGLGYGDLQTLARVHGRRDTPPSRVPSPAPSRGTMDARWPPSRLLAAMLPCVQLPCFPAFFSLATSRLTACRRSQRSRVHK